MRNLQYSISLNQRPGVYSLGFRNLLGIKSSPAIFAIIRSSLRLFWNGHRPRQPKCPFRTKVFRFHIVEFGSLPTLRTLLSKMSRITQEIGCGDTARSEFSLYRRLLKKICFFMIGHVPRSCEEKTVCVPNGDASTDLKTSRITYQFCLSQWFSTCDEFIPRGWMEEFQAWC